MIRVSRATASELPGAAAVLADAFHDDPVMRSIIPGDEQRGERLRMLFLALLRSGAYPRGVVDIARTEHDDTIIGAAAWESPSARTGTFLRQLGQLPLFARAIGLRNLPRALRLLGTLESRRPSLTHWYLGEIGVSADARGLGVGSALLETRLRALDETHQVAYLESSTPQNRRLYRRLGFRDQGIITGLPGAAPMSMIRLRSPHGTQEPAAA
ncbi:GNAT family N-acetyltransferase [Protaetiibacter intestinalis]|uniref:N-acetyltransferase n=1 Tax=Protaetiibacter intestinalis TaxID=2419774 RepID=A0A387B6P4_9MICO|nr:GNAT family N-acetyltransferase [Protaetiibacter intestinalis]AYF99312.1 N-acetyltransferase [Protaetiibacter intestinalis]